MLEARGLTVSMGGKTVCRELSFAVQPGECWGVLGQNGAGKSTLLRTLAGLHQPDSGDIRWKTLLLADTPRRDLAQQLGVLLQSEGGEFWGSVLDYVLLGRFPHRRAWFGYSADDEVIASQAMAAMDLTGLAQRPLNQLSGGERQRAAIAQLLAQQAQCLLLDEPLQHLDLRHQAQVMELFSGMKERAVLMVLHDLQWAQRCCDHLLLMFPDGQVLAGATAELLTREHLEALYQCRLRVAEVEGERCFLPGV